ncbi:MAG: DUF86 domain-containing protein [Anaerolineae bacterium]|nr:DUF86 domain-containing protein [Anaerolineae bacterium]
MLDNSNRVLSYMRDVKRRDFEQDEKLQLAVTRLLEIIGEAAANLSQEFREEHSTIPWGQIIGMRNRLIHAYFHVDLEVVWNTTQTAVPSLVQQITAIVTKMDEKQADDSND